VECRTLTLDPSPVGRERGTIKIKSMIMIKILRGGVFEDGDAEGFAAEH
jgi:hypothetical protein